MPGCRYNLHDLAGPKMLGMAIWATAYSHFFLLNKAENRKTGKLNRLNFLFTSNLYPAKT